MRDYAKRFTDLPFLLFLDEEERDGETVLPGRCVRFGSVGGNNPEWKFVIHDRTRKGPAVPNGSIGSRYGEEGTWNLEMRDCYDRADLDPVLSYADLGDETEWKLAAFPVFLKASRPFAKGPSWCAVWPSPARTANSRNASSPRCSTSSRQASPSIRGHGGDVASGTKTLGPTPLPHGREAITGVPAEDMIPRGPGIRGQRRAHGRAFHDHHGCGRQPLVQQRRDLPGHDFPDHALRLSGRIRRGAGRTTWGQEKVRPLAGWTTVTVGSDWMGPPRLHNGTSFYYFALDSWRHELLSMDKLTPPDRKGASPTIRRTATALAARLGWLPFYPQFKENSLRNLRKGGQAGAANEGDRGPYPPNASSPGISNCPWTRPTIPPTCRVMVFWRANPLWLQRQRGMNTSLKYLLGTESSFLGEEARQPETIRTTPEPDSPEGVGGGNWTSW